MYHQKTKLLKLLKRDVKILFFFQLTFGFLDIMCIPARDGIEKIVV